MGKFEGCPANGVEPLVFEAGGLQRRVEIQRLPDRPGPLALDVRRRLPVRPGRDTRLYVRIQQMDGHRAWSSPIYLFR